jgi:hypothetical protein
MYRPTNNKSKIVSGNISYVEFPDNKTRKTKSFHNYALYDLK